MHKHDAPILQQLMANEDMSRISGYVNRKSQEQT